MLAKFENPYPGKDVSDRKEAGCIDSVMDMEHGYVSWQVDILCRWF